MIDRLLEFCFDHRRTMMLLAVVLTVAGYFAWTTLAIEAYPELAPVTVQVTPSCRAWRRGDRAAGHDPLERVSAIRPAWSRCGRAAPSA